MTSTGDDSASGIPRWACPWKASSTSMRNDQPSVLPRDAQRRIKRIGVAATGVAATIWLLAMVWVWQIIG